MASPHEALLTFLQDGRWHTLTTCAEAIHQTVADLWDPLTEKPLHGMARHAERIYALQVHRHGLTPNRIALALPTVAAAACPLCQLGQPYTPSPWAIWDSPFLFDTEEAAHAAIRDYIQTHSGWHQTATLAQAWGIPLTANLVRGRDSKTLGFFLNELMKDSAFVAHRHVIFVDNYSRHVLWITRTPAPAQCPTCTDSSAAVRCPRCGAPVASPDDVIDRVQGFHTTTTLMTWHLNPPGCRHCLPAQGWLSATSSSESRARRWP